MKRLSFRTLFFLLLLLTVACSRSPRGKILLDHGWRFMPGDDPAYADPFYGDTAWKEISPLQVWDAQGYADLDGFAWYRVHVRIPSTLKENSYFKDTLVVCLGKIDDRDQTFLNGKPLGQNGVTFPPDSLFPKEIPAEGETWNLVRKYRISVDDPRIRWDEDNVIAVRVYDRGGLGGMYGPDLYVAMRDVSDYLVVDLMRSPFQINNRTRYKKVIYLTNHSSSETFSGILDISVINQENGRVIYSETTEMTIPPGKDIGHTIAYTDLDPGNCLLRCTFRPEHSGNKIVAETGVPYILTPPPPARPRINGPRVYGCRPGHPFLYLVPVTGERPVTLQAQGLPQGLHLDAAKGIIRGRVKERGDYRVTLIATNGKGSDTVTLLIRAGDLVALTPPMGWNSWNVWGLSVDQKKVEAAADAFIRTGLADHGWSYVNIDDGWEAPQRRPDGSITGNEKFPDFCALADYVHARGLKLGIYSSPGPYTCGGYLGSYQHEHQDAKTWAAWGIDYLKYDWCSYEKVAKDHSLEELQKPYRLMREALDAVDRDIVYSLCQYGMGRVWEWGAEVGGNLWRTTGDITDTWQSMSGIGFRQDITSPYASPGHWNDPDMLVVGWVGWGPHIRPTRLTPDEQYTHISLWCLLSAPLLLGCDLERLDDFTLSLLTNDEVLAIDQDPLGKQAEKVYARDGIQYWIKPLADGSWAAGVFNLSREMKNVKVHFSDMHLDPGKYLLRDLWRQEDMGTFSDAFEVRIPSHGVKLVRLRKAE